MKIDTERVGKAIARLRAMRGLTQEQLNKRIGMKTIQHIEQGRNTPSLDTLNKIADALDVPAACIVLLGSTIDPSDRVLASLNSLLETTLNLEIEQPQVEKTSAKPEKSAGGRKSNGKNASQAAGKKSQAKRDKVLA